MHTGNRIFIGLDHIACSGNLLFPEDLIFTLHRIGVFTWDKLILDWNGLSPVWKDAHVIGLPAALHSSWNQIKASL